MTVHIRLSIFQKGGITRIGIKFNYEKKVIEILRSVPFVSWSKSFSIWHMPYSRSTLKAFINVVKRHSWELDINDSALQELLDSNRSNRDARITERGKIHNQRISCQFKSTGSQIKEIPNSTLDRIKKFEEYMYQRRYSKSTICNYVSALKQFFSRHPDKEWSDISMDDIQTYNYKEFIVRNCSASAQDQCISALKLFFRLFEKEDVIPEKILRPKRGKTLPNVLTKEEVRRIILACSNIKHRCLISLIYAGGLRIGEALNLCLDDIRRKENLLYIRSAKGNKDRRVPLSAAMLKIIEEYWYAYRSEKYLFEGAVGVRYTYSSSQKLFQRAVRRSGIKISVTLHTLRHSYATHLLESGVGLRFIQELLGHSSPKTTMIYTHVSGKKLNEIKSPFDDLNI